MIFLNTKMSSLDGTQMKLSKFFNFNLFFFKMLTNTSAIVLDITKQSGFFSSKNSKYL